MAAKVSCFSSLLCVFCVHVQRVYVCVCVCAFSVPSLCYFCCLDYFVHLVNKTVKNPNHFNVFFLFCEDLTHWPHTLFVLGFIAKACDSLIF